MAGTGRRGRIRAGRAGIVRRLWRAPRRTGHRVPRDRRARRPWPVRRDRRGRQPARAALPVGQLAAPDRRGNHRRLHHHPPGHPVRARRRRRRRGPRGRQARGARRGHAAPRRPRRHALLTGPCPPPVHRGSRRRPVRRDQRGYRRRVRRGCAGMRRPAVRDRGPPAADHGRVREDAPAVRPPDRRVPGGEAPPRERLRRAGVRPPPAVRRGPGIRLRRLPARCLRREGGDVGGRLLRLEGRPPGPRRDRLHRRVRREPPHPQGPRAARHLGLAVRPSLPRPGVRDCPILLNDTGDTPGYRLRVVSAASFSMRPRSAFGVPPEGRAGPLLRLRTLRRGRPRSPA